MTQRDEGVSQFDWSSSGERIVIASRNPTEEENEYLTQRREENGPIETTRLQHKRDGEGWLDSVTTYLFVVDIDTCETTKLEAAYGAGSLQSLYGLQPKWGPSDRIAFLSSRVEWPDDSHVMDVCTIDPDGADLHVVTNNDLQASSPRWSPEGERLAFNAGIRRTGTTRRRCTSPTWNQEHTNQCLRH